LLNVSEMLQGTVQKLASVGNMWKLIFVDNIDKMTAVSTDWAATAPRKRKVHNSAFSHPPILSLRGQKSRSGNLRMGFFLTPTIPYCQLRHSPLPTYNIATVTSDDLHPTSHASPNAPWQVTRH
jgi:hypothetical protein